MHFGTVLYIGKIRKDTQIVMRKHYSPISSYRGRQRRRFSPLILTSILVPLILAVVVVTTAVFILPRLQSHAAGNAPNPNCSLIVPRNPLTAQGLATPYQLMATNPDNGACNEANAMQAAFVQGAVIDPNTGAISVYNPLVIDKGTKPAIAPTVPTIPAGATVALWFGFNGNNLRLVGDAGSLAAGQCVNGADGSLFGQFAYCNAPAFFRVANKAIQAHTLIPPALGTAKDGMTCPSVRDFSVVDMDQSDNVTTTYLITPDGRTAQVTGANIAALKNAQVQVNGSDNRLLAVALDGALGCTPWMAPDLANPGTSVPALPLNELQAAAQQQAPVALVPFRDPMVLKNGNIDTGKVNAYRAGVNQPLTGGNDPANTKTYCTNLRQIAPQRLLLDEAFTMAGKSPDPAAANNLLTFLEQRFVMTYEANGLNCLALIKQPDPVTVTRDNNGVAINGTINGIANNGSSNGSAPDCVVNGIKVAQCAGTAKINGQTCAFTFDVNTKQVVINCQNPGQ